MASMSTHSFRYKNDECNCESCLHKLCADFGSLQQIEDELDRTDVKTWAEAGNGKCVQAIHVAALYGRDDVVRSMVGTTL